MYSQPLVGWTTFQSMILPDELELENVHFSEVVSKVTVPHALSSTWTKVRTVQFLLQNFVICFCLH
jgi:hypothetical protein